MGLTIEDNKILESLSQEEKSTLLHSIGRDGDIKCCFYLNENIELVLSIELFLRWSRDEFIGKDSDEYISFCRSYTSILRNRKLNNIFVK